MSRARLSAEHVVIGAGIIGLTTACELLESGVPGEDIALVDPHPAHGATHVAGGMLAPVAEVQFQQEALYPLMGVASQLYPTLLTAVSEKTCLPTGHNTAPTLVVGADAADARHVAALLEHQQRHGMDARRVTIRQARAMERGLSPQLAGAVEIPGDHQVNPRMLAAALIDILSDAGVRWVEEPATQVTGPMGKNGLLRRCDVVATTTRDIAVGTSAYLCNGLGTAEVTGWHVGVTSPLQLRPVRGDLLRLRVTRPGWEPTTRVIRAFVNSRPVYIIPRTDGTVAIGATSREDDRVGPAVDGVLTLLRDAARVLPAVEDCEFIEALAGARPGTPDDLPYLGQVGENLVVSTGYFRHGILLAPLGARAAVAWGLGESPHVDLAACDPLRHWGGSSEE
ncbi:MAG TPA: glycine oxidase ThiO [Candidatus Corynebacterium gallistercoris]|uniref:glycine oxidase n=1 Tax=Candidatus Corynebacterium gallistercoris TaxID=2838530 RepID=A0A9D1S000_9CORY|nr:glycine oxidase ThiO [Candidatus Corynebacterium gallistercoris]